MVERSASLTTEFSPYSIVHDVLDEGPRTNLRPRSHQEEIPAMISWSVL